MRTKLRNSPSGHTGRLKACLEDRRVASQLRSFLWQRGLSKHPESSRTRNDVLRGLVSLEGHRCQPYPWELKGTVEALPLGWNSERMRQGWQNARSLDVSQHCPWVCYSPHCWPVRLPSAPTVAYLEAALAPIFLSHPVCAQNKEEAHEPLKCRMWNLADQAHS